GGVGGGGAWIERPAIVAAPLPRGSAAQPSPSRGGLNDFAPSALALSPHNCDPLPPVIPCAVQRLAVHRRHGILRHGSRGARGKIPAQRRTIACCGASGMTGGEYSGRVP